jgi:two-component system OmpR family response regulator
MNSEQKIKLFLVDDDMVFLKAMEIEFSQTGNFDVKTYATGELCLEAISEGPDIIILDYHLDDIERDAMNGIQTLDKIKELKSDVPVVMLSSQDKIDIAINCMHHNAIDYVVKSETSFVRLQKIIDTIFANQKMQKQLNWYIDRM